MTKISFKLTSGLNAISLNWPIKFSRIKVEKLRYITSVDYTGVLSIQWQGLDIHSYVDATKVFEYFFMLFVENSNNRCINFISQNDDWDYEGITRDFTNFTINVYIDGVIDSGITANNPLLIEFEYV
jgi:hypothetical protein